MTQTRRFKLYILRYVESAIRQEFVNIGVCVAEYGNDADRFVGVEFLNNWDRLHAFFPHADIDFLKEWCVSVAKELRSFERRDVALEQLESLDSTISVFMETKAIETKEAPDRVLQTAVKENLALGPEEGR